MTWKRSEPVFLFVYILLVYKEYLEESIITKIWYKIGSIVLVFSQKSDKQFEVQSIHNGYVKSYFTSKQAVNNDNNFLLLFQTPAIRKRQRIFDSKSSPVEGN